MSNKANREILRVDDLTTVFDTEQGLVKAVDQVSFSLYRGETLGVVGESGCGKSLLCLSILGLVPAPGRILSGSVIFDGMDILRLNSRELREIRGNRISMIFQEPMTSLNPVIRVGSQVTEALIIHKGMDNKAAKDEALRLLAQVEIPDVDYNFRKYPHQLSGGMRQRVMIAMAISCQPDILIADEPTTAIDVTIQNQVLNLLAELQKKLALSMIFVTHDLGVISRIADRVIVMYSGKIVEEAPIREFLNQPAHPYSRALLSCATSLKDSFDAHSLIPTIPGRVPSPYDLPEGCHFDPRCSESFQPCSASMPPLLELTKGHKVRCHIYSNKLAR